MMRHALCVALFFAVANCQGGGPSVNSSQGGQMDNDNMTMYGPTPESLVKKAIEAGAAKGFDSSFVNGQIDTNEFYTNLFEDADADSNGEVTLVEFVDKKRQTWPFLPTPVLITMFNLLDNLNNDKPVPDDYQPPCGEVENVFSNIGSLGDGKLKRDDVTPTALLGKSNPSVQELGEGLVLLISEAAKRVVKNKSKPFKKGDPYSVEFDIRMLIDNLDANKDTIISASDLNGLFNKVRASGEVNRSNWVETMVDTYGQHPYVALAIFDYMDTNEDQLISMEDTREILMAADANKDERVTRQEMFRFWQRKDKLLRRAFGAPIKPFMYDCPNPQWGEDDNDCDEPEIDATLVTMFTDFDFDGTVTASEMKHFLKLMDKDDNGKVHRVEFIQFYYEYFDVSPAVADLEFDVSDMDGNGYFDWQDYEKHFKDHAESVCACEFRLSVLASARVAGHLAKERKNKMEMTRMKYFVLLNSAISHARFPEKRENQGAMSTWNMYTMPGKPARGQCKPCSAKDNWNMEDKDKENQKDDDEMDDEDEKIMHMLVAALKKMNVMKRWEQQHKEWKMMTMLMHAMYYLKKEEQEKEQKKDGPMQDLAHFMAMKLATMHMKQQNKDDWDMWGDKDSEEKKDKKDSSEEKKDKKDSWDDMMGWGDNKKDDSSSEEKDDKEEKMKGMWDALQELMKTMKSWKKGSDEEEDKKKDDDKDEEMKGGKMGWFLKWKGEAEKEEEKDGKEGEEKEDSEEDGWGKAKMALKLMKMLQKMKQEMEEKKWPRNAGWG